MQPGHFAKPLFQRIIQQIFPAVKSKPAVISSAALEYFVSFHQQHVYKALLRVDPAWHGQVYPLFAESSWFVSWMMTSSATFLRQLIAYSNFLFLSWTWTEQDSEWQMHSTLPGTIYADGLVSTFGCGGGRSYIKCAQLLLLSFSHSVMSSSLQPHGLKHARLPCPSPPPGAYSNCCPLSQWCHTNILSSVIPFFCCPQSFSASGSFLMSQLFTSGGQSIRDSTAAPVLPMNIQDWFPLALTGLIL